MIIELIDEAVKGRARREQACALLGLSSRGVARWRIQDGGEDRRQSPTATPAHALTDAERKLALDTANRPEFRNLSPRQIVPLLADRGEYIASESSFYRVLREEGQLAHRQHARPARRHRPKEHVARGPNEVWSWDITSAGVSATRSPASTLVTSSRRPSTASGPIRRNWCRMPTMEDR
jgi:putative transposase